MGHHARVVYGSFAGFAPPVAQVFFALPAPPFGSPLPPYPPGMYDRDRQLPPADLPPPFDAARLAERIGAMVEARVREEVARLAPAPPPPAVAGVVHNLLIPAGASTPADPPPPAPVHQAPVPPKCRNAAAEWRQRAAVVRKRKTLAQSACQEEAVGVAVFCTPDDAGDRGGHLAEESGADSPEPADRTGEGDDEPEPERAADTDEEAEPEPAPVVVESVSCPVTADDGSASEGAAPTTTIGGEGEDRHHTELPGVEETSAPPGGHPQLDRAAATPSPTTGSSGGGTGPADARPQQTTARAAVPSEYQWRVVRGGPPSRVVPPAPVPKKASGPGPRKRPPVAKTAPQPRPGEKKAKTRPSRPAPPPVPAEPVPCDAEADAGTAEPVPCDAEADAGTAEPVPCDAEADAETAEPVPCDAEADVGTAGPVPCDAEADAETAEPVPCDAEADVGTAEPVPCDAGTTEPVARDTQADADPVITNGGGARKPQTARRKRQQRNRVTVPAAATGYGSDDEDARVQLVWDDTTPAGVALPLQQAGLMAAAQLGPTDSAMVAGMAGESDSAVAECGVLAAAAGIARKEQRRAAEIELLFALAGALRRAADEEGDPAAQRARLVQSAAQVEKALCLLLDECGPSMVAEVVSVCMDQARGFTGTAYGVGGRRLLHHAASLCESIPDATERERWQAKVRQCFALAGAGSDRAVAVGARVGWQASVVDCLATDPVLRFQALVRLGDLHAQSGMVMEAGRAYSACLGWFSSQDAAEAAARNEAGMALAWRLTWVGEANGNQDVVATAARLGVESSTRACRIAETVLRTERAQGRQTSPTDEPAMRLPAAFHAVRFALVAARATAACPDKDALRLLHAVFLCTGPGPSVPTTIDASTGFADPIRSERRDWFPWDPRPLDRGADQACTRWRGLIRQAAKLPQCPEVLQAAAVLCWDPTLT